MMSRVIGMSARRLFKILHTRLPEENEVRDGLGRYYRFFFGVDRCFGGLRKYGIFQIWTREFMEAFAEHLKNSITAPDSIILDAGAGNGLLTYWLRLYGFNVIAVDNRNPAWIFIEKGRCPEWVLYMDFVETLNKFKPEIVIVSWMGGSNWTASFASHHLREFILIGEPPGKYSDGCGSEWDWGEHDGYTREGSSYLTEKSLSYLDFLGAHQKGRKSIVVPYKKDDKSWRWKKLSTDGTCALSKKFYY